MSPVVPYWKKNPFTRLLPLLVAGILLQPLLPVQAWWALLVLAFTLLLLFFTMPLFRRYTFATAAGSAVFGLLAATGALLSFYNDIRHTAGWFGHHYRPYDTLQVTIDEPPVLKPRSVKALAGVNAIYRHHRQLPVCGKIILYFQKDSSLLHLPYGTRLLLRKPLQPVPVTGNPGSFEYREYALQQGITHQVYLQPGDYTLHPGSGRLLKRTILKMRRYVLGMVRRHISGEKETGLMEALLIGYKDDLDKTLVQSYSNTGVVHVIAISGLHLGLVYWLLLVLCRPLQRMAAFRRLSPIILIAGLWTFTLLAGAQPSILRSALMFSCMVLAKMIARKTSSYNSLACSAFILLCINPGWLRDVGFQLSYCAILSILLFMKPIYHGLYFRNPFTDLVWQLCSVTLAAQLLTTPVSVYHFHQFPNYFLLANMVAVPLSTLILFTGILLCCFSFFPFMAGVMGRLTSALIRIMNGWIERIESLPFPVWEGLQVNLLQTLLLTAMVMCGWYWLRKRSWRMLLAVLVTALLFTAIRSWSFIQAERRHLLIVYNIPRLHAMDIISGRRCYSRTSSLPAGSTAARFYLAPSRSLYRVHSTYSFTGSNRIQSGPINILVLDNMYPAPPLGPPQPLDILVVSAPSPPRLHLLLPSFTIQQVVLDATVPARTRKQWAADCTAAGIPFHDVVEEGAFVRELE